MKMISIHPDRPDNHDRWLLTYADMITLLTAFFLMLYSMSVVSRGKFSLLATSVRSGFSRTPLGVKGHTTTSDVKGGAKGASADAGINGYENAMGNLSRYVEHNKLGGQVTRREDARGVVLSLVADGMLFNRGQANLRSNSIPVLERVAQVMQSVPNDVQIEGHTCDLPIHTAIFPSNWELSTARAASVLRFFTDHSGLPEKRFTAAGYSDTRPVAANDSEAHRAQNRRVDIVILKSDAQREAEEMRQAEVRRITRDPSPANSAQNEALH